MKKIFLLGVFVLWYPTLFSFSDDGPDDTPSLLLPQKMNKKFVLNN